jgi:hypothetical protein
MWVSIQKTQQQLILYTEAMALYCKHHKQHTKASCGQNAEFIELKNGGIYTNYEVLKD